MLKNKDVLLTAVLIFLAVVFLAFFSSLVGKRSTGVSRGVEVAVGGKVFEAEVAATAAARTRGLSGRDGLGENEGMLFVFEEPGNYGFWMKEMKFPIDIIWIKGDKVLGWAAGAEPEPGKPDRGLKVYYPPEAVDYVLEVRAGSAEKYGIKIGDSVSVSYP